MKILAHAGEDVLIVEMSRSELSVICGKDPDFWKRQDTWGAPDRLIKPKPPAGTVFPVAKMYEHVVKLAEVVREMTAAKKTLEAVTHEHHGSDQQRPVGGPVEMKTTKKDRDLARGANRHGSAFVDELLNAVERLANLVVSLRSQGNGFVDFAVPDLYYGPKAMRFRETAARSEEIITKNAEINLSLILENIEAGKGSR